MAKIIHPPKLVHAVDAMASHYWETACEIYPKLVRFDCPKIELNNRLTKTAGRAWGFEKIDLAYKFFPKNMESMFKIILPHEIAHCVNAAIFPKWHNSTPHGHDKKWAEIMNNFGLESARYHNLVI